MNTQDNPLPFLLNGHFGDYVARIVDGKQVIFRKRSPRKGEPSIRELQARRNMSMASQFLTHIIPIVKKYDEPNGKKGVYLAMSHILRHAIKGHHPDQRIDFSQVVLGNGSLLNPVTYHVESPAKGLLEFTWSTEFLRRKQSKYDRIFTVAYCEMTHEFRYELSGPQRRERKFLMDVSCFSGQRIEVYFGFESFNALVSTSVYAGPVNVL